MTPRLTVRRVVAFLVRNWPLKLAAIVVATLLYAGLVLSQDSTVFPGPVKVDIKAGSQPAGTIVTNQLRDVEEIRYIAPADLGRLRADDFKATVDLANVKPDGQPATVRVDVTPIDPRVTILEVRPRTVQVILDELVSKDVPVRVDEGTAPEGVTVGEPTIEPARVTVSGASALVKKVVDARVSITIDPSGVDVDRDIQPDPVDENGALVTGVDLQPQSVRVKIAVITNAATRSLPVNPMVAGSPAPGFRIAGVTVEPLVVLVEGDADQLAQLVQADTQPVAVFGATSDVQAVVALALPAGVVPLGTAPIRVTVSVEPVTETRTFSAGLRLDGRSPELTYAVPDEPIVLTLFGSVSDLDRLAAAPLVVAVNVAGLGPGTHELAIVPSLPSGITLAALSPERIAVTIRAPAPSPTPTPPPSVAPSAPAESTPPAP